MYASDWRESGAMAAIDTAYTCTDKGADAPGHFIVPAGCTKLTKVTIGLASLVQDLYIGTTSAIKLAGAGIAKECYFAGPMFNTGSAGATSGHTLQGPPMVYKTNIDVKGGNEIKCTAFIHGEDPVSAHVIVGLEYDGIPGRIKSADYREETTGTAANTEVTLATRGDEGAVGDMTPQGTIVEIVVGFINDPDGHATDSFNVLPVIELTGNGLNNANNALGFIAHCGAQGPDTDVAGGDTYTNPVRYEVPGIRTKVNGKIRARGQNVESISEGHAIVCLCYG